MAITVNYEPKTMYAKQPQKKRQVTAIVQGYDEMPVGTDYATVVCGPHTSYSDMDLHITVDFFTVDHILLGRYHVACSKVGGKFVPVEI